MDLLHQSPKIHYNKVLLHHVTYLKEANISHIFEIHDHDLSITLQFLWLYDHNKVELSAKIQYSLAALCEML